MRDQPRDMRDQPREWWFESDWAPSRSGQSTRICGKSARKTSPIPSWRRTRCRRADRIPTLPRWPSRDPGGCPLIARRIATQRWKSDAVKPRPTPFRIIVISSLPVLPLVSK